MEGGAAAPLPFKWKDGLAGNVHAQTTDVLSGAAGPPQKPLFVHCQSCDAEKTGMASLQVAKVVARCAVCKADADAGGGAPQPPPAPAPNAPESIPGVYKASDSVERLTDKISNRRADAANFAAFLRGADLTAAVASVDAEIAQLAARIAVLEAALGGGGGPAEAIPPPSGFLLPPVPSATFRSLVDGSIKGTCHSVECGGAQTAAEIQFRCETCGSRDSIWLPQMRSPMPGDVCCIMMMDIDEPPIEDGPCPPCAVFFDPCGCVADVTSFAEQIKQGIQSGGGRSVITKDPCTELFSMKCPNHPQGGEHESSFVHDIHHFKVSAVANSLRSFSELQPMANVVRDGMNRPLVIRLSTTGYHRLEAQNSMAESKTGEWSRWSSRRVEYAVLSAGALQRGLLLCVLSSRLTRPTGPSSGVRRAPAVWCAAVSALAVKIVSISAVSVKSNGAAAATVLTLM